jgi:hypothetical protein
MNYDDLEIGRNDLGDMIVNIEYDEFAESPREDDNLAKMICWHSRYNLGDEQPDCSRMEYIMGLVEEYGAPGTPEHEENVRIAEEWYETGETDAANELLARFRKYYYELPLLLYDHSGISMSTRADYPYNDPWDAGVVGMIILEKALAKSEGIEDPIKWMMGEVEIYDMYLRGDVYSYVIEKPDGEFLDGCSGFLGYDHVRESAKEIVESIRRDWHNDHLEQVKAWIRNKVPLEYRV